MRVIIMGNNRAGIYALEYLLAHAIDVLVVIPFRKRVQAWHESLFDYARERGVKKIYNPPDVNAPDFVDILYAFKPDIILSVYYDQILKERMLDLPTIESFNIHPSLLPRYRGTAPLIWAIINGEKYTGVTLHKMAVGVDAGEIMIQKRIKIGLKDTGYTLHLKAAQKVREIMPAFFKALKRDRIKYVAQNGEASFYGSKTPRVNELSFKESTAYRNYNIIRALTRPLPGAYFFLEDKKVHVWKAKIEQKLPRRGVKRVGDLFFSAKGIYALCKQGTLLKLEESDI